MKKLFTVLITVGTSLCLANGQRPLASSTPAEADSRGKFHSILSSQQRQHILDGRCTVIPSTTSMPKTLKDSFANVTTEQSFALADPGADYQDTDVVSRPGLPSRRLLFAGSCDDRWFVFYEHGGLGHNYAILIFRSDSNGLPQFLWGGVGFQHARNLDQLRAAVASGKFADDKNYYW
jgi:hypothetical protein